MSKRPIIDRILNKCQWITESGCLVWTGNCMDNEYGYIRIKGKLKLVHRVMWEIIVGPIPPGMTVEHLCRVRCCVNCQHHELISQGENARRALNLRWEENRVGWEP